MKDENTGNKWLRIILKTLMWILAGLTGLVLILVLIVQLPPVQNFAAKKAVSFLSEKLHTIVRLESISIGIPKTINLKGLYLEDLQHDTLLYVARVNVGVDMFGLLKNKLNIRSVRIEGLTANVYGLYPDTTFNYNFIIDAFSTTDEKVVEQSDSEGIAIRFNDIDLQNINLRYSDTLSGLDARVNIGSFATSFEEFDLDEMVLRVSDVALTNSTVSYSQTPPLRKQAIDTTGGELPILGFRNFILENVTFRYNSPSSGSRLVATIGNFGIKADTIDLKAQRLVLENLIMTESQIDFQQFEPTLKDTVILISEVKPDTVITTRTNGWYLSLKNLDFSNNLLAYRNLKEKAVEGGLDFNNLKVSNFNLGIKDVIYNPESLSANLNNLSFKEQSGFTLNELSSHIYYDSKTAILENLKVKTPKSSLGNHIELTYNSIDDFTNSIENVGFIVSLKNSRISFEDVLMVLPELAENQQFSINRDDVVSFTGAISGTLTDVLIEDFQLTNNRSTSLSLSANLQNVTNPDLLYARVQDFSFKTSAEDIYSYTREGTIPASITIPNEIAIDALFEGYLKNFNAGLELATSFGAMNALIEMNPVEGNHEVPYDLALHIIDIDAGKILNKQDTLGPVTLAVNLKGYGMNPDSLNVLVDAVVQEAFFNGYTYKDLNIDGRIINRSFNGEIDMNDPNLDFDYKGYVNANPDSLALMFDLNLRNADLANLKLSENTFQIKGNISSDLSVKSGPNPVGFISFYNIGLKTDSLDCPIDSLIVRSEYLNDSSLITLNSEIIDARLSGDIVLAELPALISQNLNHYFEFTDPDTLSIDTTKMNLRDQKLSYSLTVNDPNIVCNNLLPGLKDFNPVTLKGSYSSFDSQILAQLSIPGLNYNGIALDSLLFDISSNEDKLDYSLGIERVHNPTVQLENFEFNGAIAENTIKYKLSAAKSDTFNVLQTSGALTKTDSLYRLIIDEPITLNNTNWRVDPDNVLTFSDAGMKAEKVILSGENQLLSIITEPAENTPLKITFENFSLGNLSTIIEKEEELVRGRLNGHFILFEINGSQAFTSNLNIDTLSFMEIPVGNIFLLAENTNVEDRFDVNMELSGFGNDLLIDGNYFARDSLQLLDMVMNINRLNLEAVEPFTFGQVRRMTGYLSGDMEINGTTDDPDLEGNISFNGVGFEAAATGAFLKLLDNTLVVRNKQFIISDLTLADSLNNEAVISGNIGFSDLTNPTLDLRLRTNDFLAMNSTSGNNGVPIYGKVLLDSDVRVKGSVTSPVVDMKVTLQDDSELTFVMPESEIVPDEGEGVIVFSDSLYKMPEREQRADTVNYNKSTIEGIKLNASITLEPKAILKMMVDPVAGDSLFVSGDANLNFSLTPGGQMNLTGTFEVNDGGYNITLNQFIKRQFRIQEGSLISWSGDIMDANVDLSAIYEIETSPLLLLEDQVDGAEEIQQNQFRNNLTFLVLLNLKGELMKPEINFDIQQPEDERGALNGMVDAKLNQLRTDESQMNKQVFALLALNRFLGQDPFESGGAPLTVESAARSSASKLLTQQFSSLSEKYIKGVDLDIGVKSFEEYNEEGMEEGRTQLQLGLSKEFLNDRVIVQVGGNVELEGERSRQNQASDIAGNVNVEYKLTPNGRYRLKGFRRIEYEDPIEGELINTGIGVSYNREFRTFRQLFWSKKRIEEWRKSRQLNEGVKTDDTNK